MSSADARPDIDESVTQTHETQIGPQLRLLAM
jgi:hypothetical protein